MGFMDSLKRMTGMGLNAQQTYERAYEKGVLLGEKQYGAASRYFQDAAAKATQEGNDTLATRAAANAALYGFIVHGGAGYLRGLHEALESMDDIEQIGSSTETMPAQPLLGEVRARLIEVATTQASGEVQKSEAHQKAAAAFKRIFQHELITYRYKPVDQHSDSARSRF